MSVITADSYRVIDPVLTTLAQGYQNATLVADALFPVVKVSSSKGRIPKFNKTAFITRDTSRAAGARSNRISDMDYELIPYQTIENDVEASIDYLEEESAETFMKLEQKVMQDLSDIIALGREKEAATYIQNISHYKPDALTNCANAVISDPATHPIQVVKQAADALRRRIGVRPNTAIIGATVYSALLNHPDIIDRVKFSGLRKVNTIVLSELFEIPTIKVGYAQASAGKDKFADIWRDMIVLAYVNENEPGRRSQYSPSFGYTLQKRGQPEIDSYYENGGKVKIIRCTDNYAMQVTCPEAAHLIFNCLTSNK